MREMENNLYKSLNHFDKKKKKKSNLQKHKYENAFHDPLNSCGQYHDASPTRAVKGVRGHLLFAVVSDEERRVVGIGHIQQEVQDRVRGSSIGTWVKDKNNLCERK